MTIEVVEFGDSHRDWARGVLRERWAGPKIVTRGFRTVAVHSDAVSESRKLKPEIPEIGIDGIPIRDEIEMELRLDSPSGQDEVQLELIRTLFWESERRNARFWLFGGWGIDALLGSVSRDHSDIDVLAEASSRTALRAALEHIGGEISDNGTGWWFHKDEIGVDIGFILTYSDGTVVSDVDHADPNVYPWPPGSFPEECNGLLAGLQCRAISWEAQYIARAGYRNAFPDTALREKDNAYLETIARHVPADKRRELETRWFGGIPREGVTAGQAGRVSG